MTVLRPFVLPTERDALTGPQLRDRSIALRPVSPPADPTASTPPKAPMSPGYQQQFHSSSGA